MDTRTDALATVEDGALASFTQEQKALIKRTCAPNATDDELAMFLHVAAKAGLDPLQKQIHFSKRKTNVGTKENPKWEDRVTIQAGVDGLQARALRQPDCEGIRSAVVYAQQDFVFDHVKGEVVRHHGNPFNQGRPIGAWGIVRRRGRDPFVAVVRFEEYVDDRSPVWRGKPAVMIEKVARSTALRRAYPENFSNIYEPAEMGGASVNAEAEAISGHGDPCLHPTPGIDADGFCGACGVQVAKPPQGTPAPASARDGAQSAGDALADVALKARAQSCGQRAKDLGLDADGFRALIEKAGVRRGWKEWTLEDVVAIEAAVKEREDAEADLRAKLAETDGSPPPPDAAEVSP